MTLRLRARLLDLDLESCARVLCLFGPSGSGKTTCLEAIAGLLRPERGLIAAGGKVLFGPGVDLAPRARGVGYLPQAAPLFPHLSVRENLLYADPDADPAPVADGLGLTELLDRAPRTLSGGEGRRAALGRALLRGPSLLLLDEPFSGLEAPLRAQLILFLARTALPQTILVTHDPRDAVALADEVILLDRGRLAGRGTPGEVFSPDSPLVEPHALIHGIVREVRGEVGTVEVEGRMLHARLGTAEPGERVRLWLRADEVTLSLGRHDDVSARNRLEATVVELRPRGAQILVALDAGMRLYSVLDGRSAERLALRPGSRVMAQCKTAALKRAGL
ncbi:MAG: ATP-binding cassette domain-containing protein [Planctomycetaceae bacterium]